MSAGILFQSREQAGHQLGEKLYRFKSLSPLVMAIPSGGVPVARAVADVLGADLDIASMSLSTSPEAAEFAAVTADSWEESSGADLSGRLILLVDDGISKGTAALTLARRLQELGASQIVIVTPVACESAVKRIKDQGFEVEALHVADQYKTLEQFYGDFAPVQGEEVESVRQQARSGLATAAAREETARELELDLGDYHARVSLHAPSGATGAVLLVSDDRASSIWRSAILDAIRSEGLANLVLEIDSSPKDVSSRARLVRRAIEAIATEPEVEGLPLAMIAAGLYVGAALEAAASVPERIRCVIAVSGQVDEANDFLPRVMAPTLLAEAAGEEAQIERSREALRKLGAEHTLVLIEGLNAHGEHGKIRTAREELAKTTVSWLNRFLKTARPERGSSKIEMSVGASAD